MRTGSIWVGSYAGNPNWEMNATMSTRDEKTGRPLQDGTEAVETLSDQELDAELTIAMYDEERREQRVHRLQQELQRRRGRQRIQPEIVVGTH